MNPMLTLLERTLSCGRALIEHSADRSEEYLGQLDQYLALVDSFAKSDPSSLNEAERTQFETKGRELMDIHSQILSRSEEEKASVREELLGVRKRMQGLRAYLDKLPARVTVTGKRQG